MTEAANNRRRRRRAPTGIALILAALVALLLAGCGGSGESGPEGGSTSGTPGAESSAGETSGGPGGLEVSAEAKACLKEQGVEPPDFGQGGGPPQGGPPAGNGGEGFTKIREAMEACGIEPQGKPGASKNSAVFREQVEEYVACVRENGYQLPKPNFSGEGPVFNESEVDRESPEFKKASEKCQSLLGPAGGGESGESD